MVVFVQRVDAILAPGQLAEDYAIPVNQLARDTFKMLDDKLRVLPALSQFCSWAIFSSLQE
jgi:hypothetical protein